MEKGEDLEKSLRSERSVLSEQTLCESMQKGSRDSGRVCERAKENE